MLENGTPEAHKFSMIQISRRHVVQYFALFCEVFSVNSRCGYIWIVQGILEVHKLDRLCFEARSEDALLENFNNTSDTLYIFRSIANNLSTCSASLVLVTTNSIPYR